MPKAKDIVNSIVESADELTPDAYFDYYMNGAEAGPLLEIGFGVYIHTTRDYMMRENAQELGISIDDSPEISSAITRDYRTLELNMLGLLREGGLLLVDTGHDSDDALVCTGYISGGVHPYRAQAMARFIVDAADGGEPVDSERIGRMFGKQPDDNRPPAHEQLWARVSEWGRQLLDVSVEFGDTAKLKQWLGDPVEESKSSLIDTITGTDLERRLLKIGTAHGGFLERTLAAIREQVFQLQTVDIRSLFKTDAKFAAYVKRYKKMRDYTKPSVALRARDGSTATIKPQDRYGEPIVVIKGRVRDGWSRAAHHVKNGDFMLKAWVATTAVNEDKPHNPDDPEAILQQFDANSFEQALHALGFKPSDTTKVVYHGSPMQGQCWYKMYAAADGVQHGLATRLVDGGGLYFNCLDASSAQWPQVAKNGRPFLLSTRCTAQAELAIRESDKAMQRSAADSLPPKQELAALLHVLQFCETRNKHANTQLDSTR